MHGAVSAPPKVRILIIDDDEDDFFITREYLLQAADYELKVDWCHNFNDALEQLCSTAYDLYFCDFRLGSFTGIDLLKAAGERNCEAPIILLTGKGNRDVAMEAMQLGAVDYLVKTELNAERMERTLRYALERLAAMRALQANERKYRSIFEKTKDIVFLASETLDFLDINEASTQLLDFPREELLKSNLCDLIQSPEKRTLVQALLEKEGAVNDLELRMNRADGGEVICLLSASVESSPEGQSYVQGIIHDITELKREARAAILAAKMAAAGRLVRTLAHEVRNPLNNITLSAEGLSQEPMSDSVEFFVSMIRRNALRISELITTLLDSARPTEIQLAQTTLQEVLGQVVADAYDRLTLKGIKLETEYPDEPVPVIADSLKLKLALQNLVTNAIEAMDGPGSVLRISLSEQPGGTTLLSIADNGCGISAEHMAQLFEPYFTQKKNGMGLGLSLTLAILQGHHAKIEVHSKQGEYTVFEILFPSVAHFQTVDGENAPLYEFREPDIIQA